jgi:Flp pilus assembly protein TadD
MVRFWFSRPFALLAVLIASLSASSTAQQTSAHPPNDFQPPAELFKRLSPSVFVVETLDAKGTAIALGSAVSVAKDEVVTNRHVVEDGKAWRVRQGDSIWTARIAFLDSGHDLCGLQVSGLSATPVTTRAVSTLSVGERVYAIGAPEGLELSLSEGLVSGLRKFEGVSFIQTTAPISHGSSGGGLFDAHGKLIGITTSTVKDGQNLNFAIPAELVIGLKDHPATEIHQTEAEGNASQAMLLWQVALNAVESGTYEKALEAFKELSRLTPDNAAVWRWLGQLYLRSKQPDSALEACQKAVHLSSEQGDNWACLGDVYEAEGQYPQAEEAQKRAVDLDPDVPVNWFGLGRVFADEGKKIGVMTVYERLKALDHNYADTYYQLFVRAILENSPDP